MRNSPTWVAALLVLLFVVDSATATVTELLPFSTLVDRARLVFRGQVEVVEPAWKDERGQRFIATTVRFRVLRPLKGSMANTLSVELLGGTIGDEGMRISGMPVFAVGDEDVLCLASESALFPVIGGSQGRFRVLKGSDGGRRVAFNDGTPVFSLDTIGRARVLVSATPLPAMDLDRFEAAIIDQVGRSGR